MASHTLNFEIMNADASITDTNPENYLIIIDEEESDFNFPDDEMHKRYNNIFLHDNNNDIV